VQSFEGAYSPEIVDVTKTIPLIIVTQEDALEEVDEVVIDTETKTRTVTLPQEEIAPDSFDMVLRTEKETYEVKKVAGYRTFFTEANGQVLSASEPIYATKTVKVKRKKNSVQFDEKTGKYFIPAREEKIGEYDAHLENIKKSYGSSALISPRRELEEVELRSLGMSISTQTKALQYAFEKIEELEARIAKLEGEK
jgi:anion-transporting  ArsA/GET3 family ATPase